MAAEQTHSTVEEIQHERAPSYAWRVCRIIGAVAAVVAMASMTAAGAIFALICVTPVVLLFSPLLIPGGALLFFSAAGFLFVGGLAMAAVSALWWIVTYLRDKHPRGAGKVDLVRQRISGKALQLRTRVQDVAAAS